MLRCATTVLLLAFLLTGSLAASGLCFVLESVTSNSSVPTTMSGQDDDCTCKMSSVPDNLAASTQWTPATVSVFNAAIEFIAVDIRPAGPVYPPSFDTITPTPPPKA